MSETDKAADNAKRRGQRQEMQKHILARAEHAIVTDAGFSERWARFWANHFTVAGRKSEMVPLVGPYEREAIRPHVYSSFRELTHAAVFHQAMLVYLDNHRSIGPSTRIAKRRKAGLNENLAREVMELHTLGVESGYSQDDVTAFAKALTGWTIASPPRHDPPYGAVIFDARVHEQGRQRILGKAYAQNGAAQAKAILDDLCSSADTARHIATKLARHFVADAPPESAIDKLESTFLKANGDLSELAKAVVTLDEAWEPEQRKFKTPDELLISAARAISGDTVFGRDARRLYTSLGQTPFRAPSPDGWADVAGEWAGPDAIKKRLEWANTLAKRTAATQDSAVFLQTALGELVSDHTRQSVSRAESQMQGLTLALMSPEFQRR